MRFAPLLLAGVALGLVAHAQTPSRKVTSKEMTRMLSEMAQWQSEWRKSDHISRRAMALKPARRDEPLRYLNISDEEVRQVQFVSARYLPRVLVNISPVVTNCPCEEGPNCSAQVYVVATTGEVSKGLQLSRLKDEWTVGQVQQWWLRREALQVPPPDAGLPEHYRYEKALYELYSEFPRCLDQKAEPKK